MQGGRSCGRRRARRTPLRVAFLLNGQREESLSRERAAKVGAHSRLKNERVLRVVKDTLQAVAVDARTRGVEAPRKWVSLPVGRGTAAGEDVLLHSSNCVRDVRRVACFSWISCRSWRCSLEDDVHENTGIAFDMAA